MRAYRKEYFGGERNEKREKVDCKEVTEVRFCLGEGGNRRNAGAGSRAIKRTRRGRHS